MNLEEVADEYEKANTGIYPEVGQTSIRDAFIDGYNLCREQMMKVAVYAEILLTPYPTICLDDCKDYDFKDGQKVRIIIVKENKK